LFFSGYNLLNWK